MTQVFRRNFFGPAFFRVSLPWAIRHPRYLLSARYLYRAFNESSQRRKELELDGLKVPPTLILSLTQQCNLSCSGCFAAASGITCHKRPENKNRKPQLDLKGWRSIVSEASELGVFCFFLAGGEPFLFPKLLDICGEFKDRCFIIFTNGTALKERDFERLKGLSNTVVIVSIEGGKAVTDLRRGEGVYQKALNSLKRLTELGTPNGVSATITRHNYKYWMNPERIDSLIAQGIRAAVFIEYIPVMSALEADGNQNTANKNEWIAKDYMELMLTEEERAEFRAQILRYRETKPIYIIHSPGDEDYFGGCVSAGRGFAHVTPSGDLTPCPVSNVATHNVATATLKEGFASPLFTRIRESEHLLENEGMPCSLFAHPKEVKELADSVGAYTTD